MAHPLDSHNKRSPAATSIAEPTAQEAERAAAQFRAAWESDNGAVPDVHAATPSPVPASNPMPASTARLVPQPVLAVTDPFAPPPASRRHPLARTVIGFPSAPERAYSSGPPPIAEVPTPRDVRPITPSPRPSNLDFIDRSFEKFQNNSPPVRYLPNPAERAAHRAASSDRPAHVTAVWVLAVACIALSILAAAKLFGSRNADPASVSPSRSESIPVERGKP